MGRFGGCQTGCHWVASSSDLVLNNFNLTGQNRVGGTRWDCQNLGASLSQLTDRREYLMKYLMGLGMELE